MEHDTYSLSGAHALDVAAVAAALDVDPAVGLNGLEAARRLDAIGPNELTARHRASLLRMLREAITEPFVLLLLAAGLLAVALGEVRDGFLVLVGLLPIVGADLVIGYRGERALEALRDSAAPMASVRREGTVGAATAASLVPGDVVLIAVGDIVPADIRLTLVDALLLDRSVLTGESVPETGSIETDAATAVVVDQRCLAFSGTRVVQGRGEGIVVETGPRSRLGQIASALGGSERRRSPVQRELDRLVRILLTVAIALVAVTAGLALLRGETVGVAVLAGVAAAIAAIPEEPPVLLAVILGLGAYRLLKKGVLVRRLSAQETLSAVDLILTDKTGTLTRNELSVDAAYTPTAKLEGAELERIASLALRAQDDAWHRARGSRSGGFTRGLERFLPDAPKLDPAELIEAEPASGAHPYTRTLSRIPQGSQELLMGAPETLLGLLSSDAAAQSWRPLIDRHADAGRRLLLLAERRAEPGLVPLALISFSDPLRPGVGPALTMATQAGIQTIVVTGDHPLTAARIAAAAGLPQGTAVTGDELSGWSDERLISELPGLRLVARALPEQKLRLVEAARAAGRTVAVTGDGVNDAPALEHADVAVAMGSGSAVAREASDLVLGDDSFATLMNGLAEGRRMVANIQKGLIFLISTHVALLGFVLIATLYGFSQPLLPIHILWLEFFIDISTSIAFEREPAEMRLMHQPPRPRDQPLLGRDLLIRLTVAGTWTAVAALVIMATHAGDLEHARWLALNALVVGQIVRAYSNRSLTTPVVTLRRNGVLAGACLAGLAAQFAIPYVPVLADAFGASTLNWSDWLLIGVVALAPALLADVMRGWRHRTWVA